MIQSYVICHFKHGTHGSTEYIFSVKIIMGLHFFLLEVINYLINNKINNDANIHEIYTNDNNGNVINMIYIINGCKLCV